MTTLEAVPLEEVLRDVLDGVKIIDGGLQIEQLTSTQIALVIVRVQRMRHAKVKELEDLTVALGQAKKKATTVPRKPSWPPLRPSSRWTWPTPRSPHARPP
jgi:hypothetical protein